MYNIDRNIPLPSGPIARGRKPIYPWAKMKPGDSFLVSDKAKFSSVRVNACKRSKGKTRFTTSITKQGVRVWRIK